MPKKTSDRSMTLQHPNHSNEIPRLKRIIGQLEGVQRMILEQRYCPEIIQQLRAANSAIKALELEVLKGHLNSCIRTSAKSDKSSAFENKLKELLDLIKT